METLILFTKLVDIASSLLTPVIKLEKEMKNFALDGSSLLLLTLSPGLMTSNLFLT